MNTKKTLADRMKEYESVTNYTLTKRMPIVIRVDGRAFHTVTKGFDKPYDDNFIDIMNYVACYLLENLSGAKIAYVESDEISIVLCPYDTFETEPMFDNRIQKLASVAASMATFAFMRHLAENNLAYERIFHLTENRTITFDARVYPIPREDVDNYLLWRQQDSKRNSINSFGQHYIGKKAIMGMNTSQVMEKLKEIGHDDIPNYFYYGRTFVAGKGDRGYPFEVFNSTSKNPVLIFDDADGITGNFLHSLIYCDIFGAAEEAKEA